jgi:BRCT domain type II-containing protein
MCDDSWLCKQHHVAALKAKPEPKPEPKCSTSTASDRDALRHDLAEAKLKMAELTALLSKMDLPEEDGDVSSAKTIDNKLEGQRIVFRGVSDSKLLTAISQHGGRVTQKVSGKTTMFVWTGNGNTTAEYKRALLQANCRVLTLEDFSSMHPYLKK